MAEEEKRVGPDKEVEEGKLIAALSYIWIVGLIWILFSKRDNQFILFHAKQAVALSLVCLPIALIPFLNIIGALILILVSIIALIQAALGKCWKIPGVNAITDKMTI